MASKNKQQTFGKRNRERAVEEKRRLKRERKEAERAARAAALEAGLPPPDYAGERAAAREAEAGIEPTEPETTEVPQAPQAPQAPEAPQVPQAPQA